MCIRDSLTESLKAESGADLTEATTTLSEVFKKALNNDKLTVKVENLKNADVASVLTLSEQGRRMQDMMKMYAAEMCIRDRPCGEPSSVSMTTPFSITPLFR